jgi:hypothetical protein
MLFFDHPNYVGIGVFLTLTAVYWIWRWIRFDGSEPGASDRDKEH